MVSRIKSLEEENSQLKNGKCIGSLHHRIATYEVEVTRLKDRIRQLEEQK
jgi:hypothetical protein